jgi:hypothetical protein
LSDGYLVWHGLSAVISRLQEICNGLQILYKVSLDCICDYIQYPLFMTKKAFEIMTNAWYRIQNRGDYPFTNWNIVKWAFISINCSVSRTKIMLDIQF